MKFYPMNYEATFNDMKKFNYPNQKLGVIVHIENDEGKILLQQRGVKSYDENGLYEYIGGKVETADFNFKEAIIREIKEEVGGDIRLEFKDDSIGIFHCYKNNINWIFIIYFAKYINGAFKIMEPGKCLGYKFFTYDEAINSEFVTESCKYLINNIKNNYK